MAEIEGRGKQRTVFILRGLPGSGKSYFARKLAARLRGTAIRIVSADYFFEQPNGVYKYDKRLAGRSHSECMGSFLDGLISGFQNIIVDNTNSQKWEYCNFEVLARAYGYNTTILELKCPNQKYAMAFHSRNIHQVPLSAQVSMFLRWEVDTRARLIQPYLPQVTEERGGYGGYHSRMEERPQIFESSRRSSNSRDHPRGFGHESYRSQYPDEMSAEVSRSSSLRSYSSQESSYMSPFATPPHSNPDSDIENEWEQNSREQNSRTLSAVFGPPDISHLQAIGDRLADYAHEPKQSQFDHFVPKDSSEDTNSEEESQQQHGSKPSKSEVQISQATA